MLRRLAARYPDVTFLMGSSTAQEATLADSQPNVFRFVADAPQAAAGLGAYAYRDLGWRRAAVVMDRIQASWENAAGFVTEFCALGGDVVSREVLLAPFEPGGADADRALAKGLAREVDGTLLLIGYYSPTAFLSAYSRSVTNLPRRLAIAGYGFAGPGGLSPAGTRLTGVVFGGDIPLDSERRQWRRLQTEFARTYPQLPRAAIHGLLELPAYMAAEALARGFERTRGDVGTRRSPVASRPLEGGFRRTRGTRAARREPAGDRRRSSASCGGDRARTPARFPSGSSTTWTRASAVPSVRIRLLPR